MRYIYDVNKEYDIISASCMMIWINYIIIPVVSGSIRDGVMVQLAILVCEVVHFFSHCQHLAGVVRIHTLVG